jgi:hypothetical protein
VACAGYSTAGAWRSHPGDGRSKPGYSASDRTKLERVWCHLCRYHTGRGTPSLKSVRATHGKISPLPGEKLNQFVRGRDKNMDLKAGALPLPAGRTQEALSPRPFSPCHRHLVVFFLLLTFRAAGLIRRKFPLMLTRTQLNLHMLSPGEATSISC